MGSAKGRTSVTPAEAARSLVRNPDFLVPYLAEAQSIAGDQFGRVALSILVFDRTASPAWTAFTYALTYLPAILGGFVLGGVGDRYPRVWVMVLADVARAALFLGVAIPGVPLPVAVGLVAVAFFIGPAFTAALVSRLAALLVPDRFRTASGIRMITAQVAQVGGFAVGGVIVTFLDPRAALVVNAATFGLSALIIAVALGGRRAGGIGPSASTDGASVAMPRTALALTRATEPRPPSPSFVRDRWLRHLMLMTALAAFFVVPEGLAVPLAHDLGAGNAISGLLLAAVPLGSAIGAALLVYFVPRRNGMTVARFMAIGSGVPLLVTALLPPWPVVFVCWMVSGGLWAYQVDVATALVHAVTDQVRSTAIARASAVLLGAQGIGLIVFGAVGSRLGARWGVALAGLAGVCAAVVVAVSGRRAEARTDSSAALHQTEPQSLHS
ncbi:MFS transporter [uncultured Jatrophihabitans sp.]|uniref:MFS transporter n=1 Tax=uncultured Jatrophihabitans sp. TaxID=1610747 RepID=UPI0035CA7AE9